MAEQVALQLQVVPVLISQAQILPRAHALLLVTHQATKDHKRTISQPTTVVVQEVHTLPLVQGHEPHMQLQLQNRDHHPQQAHATIVEQAAHLAAPEV